MSNLARLFESPEQPDHGTAARAPSLATDPQRPPAPIRCVLMDDSDFDRKAIRRLAEKSRYDLRVIETGSIQETKQHLLHREADILLADYRVPDGDGIKFARDIVRQGAGAPQVIVVTGEHNAASAIEAIRAGASDYLPKEEMTQDLFNSAIENALHARGRVPHAEDLPRDEAISELSSLRDVALMNARDLKASILPLLALGWQVSQGKIFAGAEREALNRKIQDSAHQLPAMIDSLVIAAQCGNFTQTDHPTDLVAILEDIAEDPAGVVRRGNAALTVGPLPQLKACPRRMRLLFESLIQASIQFCPLGKRPEISIGAARDPSHRPILWLRDNGVSLDVRKHTFGNKLSQSAALAEGDPFIWSLCQRLAETLDAELRIKAGPQDRTTVMLRFNSARGD